MCVDNRTQDQINKVLQEKFDAGHTVDLTDIPDDLWSADGEIKYWDEFVKLSKDYSGRFDNEALFACIDYYDSLEDFEKLYLGKYDSGADYARSFVEDCYNIPEFLLNYIDFKSLWNEMEEVEVNGYYFRS